jgi:hypothetical protein
MTEGNGEGDGAGDLGGGSFEITRNLQKKGKFERSEREVGTKWGREHGAASNNGAQQRKIKEVGYQLLHHGR